MLFLPKINIEIIVTNVGDAFLVVEGKLIRHGWSSMKQHSERKLVRGFAKDLRQGRRSSLQQERDPKQRPGQSQANPIKNLLRDIDIDVHWCSLSSLIYSAQAFGQRGKEKSSLDVYK